MNQIQKAREREKIYFVIANKKNEEKLCIFHKFNQFKINYTQLLMRKLDALEAHICTHTHTHADIETTANTNACAHACTLRFHYFQYWRRKMSGLQKNNNKQIHHLNLVICSWEIPCQHHNFPNTQIEMKSKMNEKEKGWSERKNGNRRIYLNCFQDASPECICMWNIYVRQNAQIHLINKTHRSLE